MREILNWLLSGTAPQWGVLFLLAVVVVRTSPQWLTVWSTLKLARQERVAARITELETSVRECREECDRQTDSLHQKLRNEAEQRVQSEISLVSTLVQIVDAPQLRAILTALESRKTILAAASVQVLGGPLRAGADGDDLER